MASSSSSSSSMPESVLCEGLEFSESNNILMALINETLQEDQFCEDDRLMSMIQSLEAEISSTCTTSSVDESFQSHDDDMEVVQVDNQDCSTSSISYSSTSDWDDMEVVSAGSSLLSSSSFDEDMMNDAWRLCAAGGDVSTYDYCDSSDFYYGVLLENSYLPQDASDHVMF